MPSSSQRSQDSRVDLVERTVQLVEYGPNGRCFKPFKVRVNSSAINSEVSRAVQEKFLRYCRCLPSKCSTSCRAQLYGFTNTRMMTEEGIIRQSVHIKLNGNVGLAGQNHSSQLEHGPDLFTDDTEIDFIGTLRDVTSWRQLYEGCLPIELEYRNLNSTPSRVTWDEVIARPKKVRWWSDFSSSASNYVPSEISKEYLRVVLPPTKKPKVQSENELYPHVESLLFGPLMKDRDARNLYFFGDFSIKALVKVKGKEIDYVLMYKNKPVCPIEIKTIATLLTGDILKYAGELCEAKFPGRRSLPYAQIYQYMVLNRVKYGVLSNFDETFFLRVVDEDGELILEISNAVHRNSREPYVHQSIQYLVSLLEKDIRDGTNRWPYENYAESDTHPRPAGKGRASKRRRSTKGSRIL